MTQEEIKELIDFELQIQWRWSCGDWQGYGDALAEDVAYVDPLAKFNGCDSDKFVIHLMECECDTTTAMKIYTRS
ncbi:MAG: hypothetical protein IJ158_08650 [Treponema sp.]|nr:hypothetical protein [Treponema sp.]